MPDRHGWPEHFAITRFDMHEVTYDAPPPGETAPKNSNARLLFRSEDL